MKTAIIYLPNDPLSVDFHSDAKKSVLAFGIDPIDFPGILPNAGVGLLEHYGAYPAKDAGDVWTPGTIGCLASHLSLWVKALVTDEPILVMEHDGIMVKDPRAILDKVEDVCHLDSLIPFKSANGERSTKYRAEYDTLSTEDNGGGVTQYPFYDFYGNTGITGGCFVGAYGYIITPKGARKVLDFIQKYGAYPADKLLCENALKLQRVETTCVKLHPFFDSIEKQRKFTTRT